MVRKVKMVNGLFGNPMWVTEDRVEEYKAAGHKLAASALKPAKEDDRPLTTKETKEEGKKTRRK